MSGRRRELRARGVTLLELLVAMGVLLLAMVSISKIFSITSDAAGVAAAHSEVIEAASAIRERLDRELARMDPESLLIIDSPAATTARSDIPNGPKLVRQRQDRLVFVTSAGTIAAYQSYTHRWASSPAGDDRSPPASPQALVYFGPGIPVDADGNELDFNSATVALPGSSWTLAHRATLLLDRLPANTDTTWVPVPSSTFESTMLGGGPIDPTLRDGRVDAILDSDPLAVIGSYLPRFADLIQLKTPADMTSPTPSIAGLWSPSLTPLSFSLNTANTDFYTRTGNLLAPRLSEFRIEWTDGRAVNPVGVNPNMNMRWFGLEPNYADNPDIANPDSLNYVAVRRRDVTAETTPAETAAFANEIEYASSGTAPATNADYRAIWRKGTWALRPKALRITFRLYDARNRLRASTNLDNDEDGDPDPDGPTQVLVTRYGEEFSFVIPLDR
jgi:hypothetical protein